MTLSAVLDYLDAAARCERADLTPLWIAGEAVGTVNPLWRDRLLATPGFEAGPDGIRFAPHLTRYNDLSAALMRLARDWRDAGLLTGWRNENFTAYRQDGTPLFELERAAFRPLGLTSRAVHVNGLVRGADGVVKMWVGRRSPDKAVDPNRLDNLTGGGIAAGETVGSALLRECWEEAGMPAANLDGLRPVSLLLACRRVSRGLHREWLYVHDLWLPPELAPCNRDGEVAEFMLMTLDEVAHRVSEGRFMADAALVALDCLARLGAGEDRGAALSAGLDAFRHPLTADRAAGLAG